jgi:hypothetical protein
LKGATLVVLAEADEPTLRGALEAAWRLKANKRQLALLEAGPRKAAGRHERLARRHPGGPGRSA